VTVTSQWGALVASVMREDDGDHDPRKVSASAVGSCLRASAWRLAGVPFSDDEPGNAAAFIGSAIHERLARRIAARRIDIAIEHDVTYSYRGVNIPGRLDLYDTSSVLAGIDGTGSLIDVKTCGDHSWGRAVAGDLSYEHIMQGNTYAAACEQAGYTVTELRWVYIHRASGRVTELAVPYHSAPARAALNARLDAIFDAAAAPETAEREGKGIVPEPGWSECNSCPFRSACWPGEAGEVRMGPHRREDVARADALAMRYLVARIARDAGADDMAAAAAELRDLAVWGVLGRTEAFLNSRGAIVVKAAK
jgi:CRISPR/Cas system-associated exonuclease Cas4 (RecB family)